MNSQNLGDLASDEKIETSSTISVIRSRSEKMAAVSGQHSLTHHGPAMRSGELSVDEVQKTYQISDKIAYKWRKSGSRKSPRAQLKPTNPTPAFAEVKVEYGEMAAEPPSTQIGFKRAGCEI